MSGGFDPYHKWLGIPAHEQPANYYRLLGLELFEEDLDAIECAADRLIKCVRDSASGEQRDDARRVLRELSAAKRCLLTVEQKRAYDAGLRAGRAATRQSTGLKLRRSSNHPPPCKSLRSPTRRARQKAADRQPSSRRGDRL
jgi:hypothetical protein